MHQKGELLDADAYLDKMGRLHNPELAKLVEADFNAMMEESMAEARALLSDDPEEPMLRRTTLN